jgi:hypothetical protein
MRSKFNILILPIAMIMLASCTKEGRLHSVSQEFRDYLLFQKGSYWIYQDDSTKAVDCTYLAGSPSYSIYKTGDHEKSDPSIEQYLLSFTSGVYQGFQIFSTINDRNYLVVFFSFGHYGFGMIDQMIPDSNYYIDKDPFGYFKVSPLISSIDINAVTYHQVINTRFNNISGESTFTFYFAKHVGLVKIYGNWDNQNQSWSLLRYHVVQ